MPLRFLNGHGEAFPLMAVPRVEHKRTPLSFAGESGQDVADRPISEKHLRPWDAVTVARCGAAKSPTPEPEGESGSGQPLVLQWTNDARGMLDGE